MADVTAHRSTLPSLKYFLSASSSPVMAAGCCRNLFGRPDRGELQHDLRLIRERLRRQKVERWNFDFDAGRPVSGGRYDWRPVTAATREPGSCGAVSPTADSNDDDQSGSQCLEPVQTSASSDSTTLRATTPHLSAPSLTAASADVPVCPLSPRKKRRTSQRHSDSPKLRRRGGSARRRTRVRRQAQIVQSAGAARVTGQCRSVVSQCRLCRWYYRPVMQRTLLLIVNSSLRCV